MPLIEDNTVPGSALEKPWFTPLYRWLIRPSDSITDLERRNRARLLAIFQLIIIPALLLMLLQTGFSIELNLYLLFGVIVITGAYFLNRRGRYEAAAALTIGVITINPFVYIITDSYSRLGTLDEVLMWVVATLISSFLLLPLREVVYTIAFNVALTLLVPFFMPEFSVIDGGFGVGFVLVVAGISLFSAYSREHDFKLLRHQTAELAQNEARYRSLFEASLEGVVVHHDGILLDANPAAERIFGLPLAEAKGHSVFDFVVPEDRESAQNKYFTEPDELFVARCRRRDGSLIWIEVRGKPFDYEGAQANLLAVRDITQLKQAEAQHMELTVEREKVRILRQFINSASHDFRTPLSTIKTSLYLAERSTGDPERQRRHLQVLNNQTDHLHQLIDDLLSMSRLDRADTSEYHFHWVEINDLVDQSVEEARPTAAAKQLILRFNAGSDLPRILLDGSEFKRMLTHLLRNAITYTPEQGLIELTTRADRAHVILEICDTGIGIGALDLPHIFERFYRADRARSTETGGNGLGLSIAKRIIEAHGGSIEVESEVEKGSVFRVLMPCDIQNMAPGALEALDTPSAAHHVTD